MGRAAFGSCGFEAAYPTASHDRAVRPAAGRNGSGYRLLIDRSRVRVPPGAPRAPVAQLAEQFRAVQTRPQQHHSASSTSPRAGEDPVISHPEQREAENLRPANAGSPLPVFTTTTAVISIPGCGPEQRRLPVRAPGCGREVGVFKSRPERFPRSVAQSLRSATS